MNAKHEQDPAERMARDIKDLDEMRSDVARAAARRKRSRSQLNKRRREQLDELTRLSEQLPGGYE